MHGLTESQKAFRASVQRLADNTLAPLAEAIDRRDVFPEQAFELLARAGLLKMAVPKKYDGLSLGAMEICLAISELARISAATALMAVASTATTRLLDLAANQDQRKRWLSFLGRGDKLAAFCLTESQAGSDAAAIRTAARREGDEYIINGLKSFVTLGLRADLFAVFVRLEDLPGPRGIGLVVVEKGAPGLKGGRIERKMGFHGSVTQELIFDNCRIPAANLVRGPGQGWSLMTEEVNTVRLWGAAAVSLGLAQRAVEEATAKRRAEAEAAGRRSPDQADQFALADMAIRLEAARSLVWRTCNLLDSGRLSHSRTGQIHLNE